MKKLLLLLLCVPLLFSCGEINEEKENTEEKIDKLAVIGQEGHTIPEFSFINQNNDIITNSDYDGNIYIANFIFTTCPTICPTMTINMRHIQHELSKYPNIKFLSHTVNPNYDTPEILKQYATKMKIDESNFNFVTGVKDSIYKIAASYFVNASEDELAPGGFLHSEYLVIVDKEGRVRSGYSNFICSKCGGTSKNSKLSCTNCNEKYTYVGNPVGSYDGTKKFVIKDMIKDIKTLLDEYHGDSTAEIIDNLENENSELEDKLEPLNNDQKELEKFARENFLMKKDNEDIIIIKEEENKEIKQTK